jgi:argininosuccinate synthase
MRCYRGNVFILGRSSETEKLYSEEESSMDSLVDFSPVDTSMSPVPLFSAPPCPPPCAYVARTNAPSAGFININAIRLKKFGQAKLEAGEGLGTK